MYKTLRFMLVSLLMMLCGTAFAEEVTMKYSGTTTANMTGENDAALVGLDASKWSVVGAKGGNSNYPGLNKAGDFRIYYSDKGSNTITVSSLDGATINYITMTFAGDTYSNVKVMVGDNAVEKNDDDQWVINSSSFVLTNGNTSNIQVRISEVVINYTSGTTTTKTVTFINDASWNAVYVWAWNDSEIFTGGTWPGEEITPDKEGNYTWSTTGDPTGIIFSDGGQNQTADLEFENGATYNSQGKVVPVQTFTATFSTNAEWNAVYAYAWSGQEANVTKFLGDWPGTQLTKDETSGKYSLSIEATEAPEKIIFNDGGNNQTEDLDFVNGKDYVYTVVPTYTSIAAMLADITSTKTNVKYQFEKLLVTYVNGSNTYVSDGQNAFLLYGGYGFELGLVAGCTYSGTVTGQIYTYNGLPEMYITEGNVNATLVTEGNLVAWPTIAPADIQNYINVPVTIENAVYVSANGKNLTFSVGDTEFIARNNWSIDVTALEADKAYTLKGVGCVYVSGETTTYQLYLASFEEYVEPVVDNNYYILGDFWGWDNPQLMTQSAETANVYTLVADVTVEADTYEYKLRQGDNWDGYQLPAQGNQNFVFGTEEYPAGTYTLTFTANLEANTLELAVERDALEQAKAELAAFIAEIEAMYNEHKDEVPADSQAEVEQAIQDAKDALNSPNATVESLAQAQADLQAAMQKAQSDALGLNENVTDKFDIEYSWISEMGAVTDYQNLKEVWLDTTTDTGKVIHKTVEKLENGTYDVKLIGGALFTGNGETAALQSDEEGRVVIYANNVALSIPVKFAQEGNTQHYELNNVVVSDGKMEIGMEKLAPGSNRHFIQIEKVKMLSNTRQVADEEGQNNHWKGIAQTILGYEAYNGVTGEPREALAAAETKEAVMAAIPVFYASVPEVVEPTAIYSVAGEPSELFGAYWNEKATETEMTLNNEGLYEWRKENVTLAGGVSVQFKVVKNHDWSVSYPANNYVSEIQEDGVYNVVITFNDKTEEVNAEIVKVGDAVIENAEITQVELRGDFNNWSATDACTMTKGETENVWTMTLDLTNATEDQKFKLVVNNEKWIGNQQMEIDAPDKWVDSAYDQDNNLKLYHTNTGYNTYTVTATWNPNANADQGWTLTFAGKDAKTPVVLNYYSAIFKTNADWDKVYAYAWSGEEPNVTKFLGEWPGKELGYNDKNMQYELGFEAEVMPDSIIFSNGAGEQTENLAFVNQNMYEYNVEKPLIANGTYYVKNVGTQKFLAAGSNWGTHAIVNEEGLDIAITLADGKYTLDTQVSNGGTNNFLNGNADDGPWADGGAYGWAVEKVSDGVFTFARADGTFVSVGDNDKLVFADKATENAQWTLVSVADHDAANLATLDAATAENGVDATFFIKGANFNRNDLRNNNWKATKSGGNQTIGGPNGDRATYGCESWNNTFEVSQTLENLPEGVYQFSIAGYGTNGTTVVFAGENEAPFVNTESAANFGAALDAIANGSYTGNVTGKVNVMNGTLKVGVKRESQVGQDWAVFDNARLTYFGPIPADEFKNAYEEALAAAQAAIADEAYAVVTGEERTALAKAIEDYSQVEATAEAYKAATIALTEATNAFKEAKGAYDGLAAVKDLVANMSFQYATAEKKATAETAAAAVANNATDATEKTAAVYKAYRQYAESSAMLEGVENATDFTSYIVNPKAEQDIAAPWSVVLGEGSGGSLGILNGQPWTDGNDNSTHRYFDGGNWGAQAWDVSLKQEIKLPAGKYQLSAKSRANTDMKSFTLFAGENKTEMQHISDQGGLFNRGWNDASVEFELTEPAAITIGVQGISEKQYQWMSFSDFRLVSFDKYEPVYTVAGAYKLGEQDETAEFFGKTWEPTQEANDMTLDNDGNYILAFSKVELVPGGTIFYKVVESHSWVLPSWGFNGENADYVVNLPEGKTLPEGKEKGFFDIVFKFNPKTVFENKFNVDCVVTYDEATTTGIKTIDNSLWTNDNVIYNLNGQKVTNVKKGLYIVNGKKTIKK